MALMLNRVHQRPGHCAVCGGTNLDYGSYDIDGDAIQYPWTCADCKAEGGGVGLGYVPEPRHPGSRQQAADAGPVEEVAVCCTS